MPQSVYIYAKWDFQEFHRDLAVSRTRETKINFTENQGNRRNAFWARKTYGLSDFRPHEIAPEKRKMLRINTFEAKKVLILWFPTAIFEKKQSSANARNRIYIYAKLISLVFMDFLGLARNVYIYTPNATMQDHMKCFPRECSESYIYTPNAISRESIEKSRKSIWRLYVYVFGLRPKTYF